MTFSRASVRGRGHRGFSPQQLNRTFGINKVPAAILAGGCTFLYQVDYLFWSKGRIKRK